MLRIESLGSIWEIDEEMLRYRRWPKQEAPREKPEWSDDRAGKLQDFVWHSYVSYWIDGGRLFIDTGGALPYYVTAPLP